MRRLRGLNPEVLKGDVDLAVRTLRQKHFSKELVEHNLNLYFKLSSMLDHISFSQSMGNDTRMLLNLALYHNMSSPKSLPAELRPSLSDLLEQFIALKRLDDSPQANWSAHSEYLANNLPLFMFRMIDTSLLPLDKDIMVRVFGYSSSKVEEQRINIARAQFYVYAPVADTLKQAQLCARLKDNSTEILYPTFYSEIRRFLTASLANMADVQHEFASKLSGIVEEASLFDEASFVRIGDEHSYVKGRIKSIGSIIAKMIDRDLKPSEVLKLHDLIAFTVVAKDSESAYLFVERLKEGFDLADSAIDDFIDKPRKNGYRAIHIDVPYKKFSIEVQVRTEEVHRECEEVGGTLAHAIYKPHALPKSTMQEVAARRVLLKEESPDEIQYISQLAHSPHQEIRLKMGPKSRVIQLPQQARVFDLVAHVVPDPDCWIVRSAATPEKKYSLFDQLRPENEYELVRSGERLPKSTLKALVSACVTAEARVAIRTLLQSGGRH
ncbi:MAG: hypothetical protein N3H30_01710 [Candidatus Micrarchaeota archaeon]|nr:hypothetical protein [Candidatus Micrarchaeota archaeon]